MPTLGLSFRFRKEARPNFFVEGKRLAVQSVLSGEPKKADVGIEVQQERQAWFEARRGVGVPLSKHLQVEAAAIALIDHGGVGVPVAENDLALGKSGADQGSDVLGAIGKKEEQFGAGVDRLALEQDLADGAAAGGSRFAGSHNLVSFPSKFLGDQGDDGAFACAFRPFERYEHAVKETGRQTGGESGILCGLTWSGSDE